MASAPLIARVKNGRLVLDVPTTLPEGAEVELHAEAALDANGETEGDDEELLRELDLSLEEADRGELVDVEVLFADMRARRA